MRPRRPLWLVAAGAAVLLLVAGGIFWAREWAVADPNLRIYAEDLVPEGGDVIRSKGSDCDATNGWDRWYRPQDTCHEVFWRLRGLDEAALKSELTANATASGWQVLEPSGENSPSHKIRLQRAGYRAFLSVVADGDADRCVEQAKSLPAPAPELCTHHLIVEAE